MRGIPEMLIWIAKGEVFNNPPGSRSIPDKFSKEVACCIRSYDLLVNVREFCDTHKALHSGIVPCRTIEIVRGRVNDPVTNGIVMNVLYMINQGISFIHINK